MSKICIVTPDIIGPVFNGGIGTACYFLALNLRDQGNSVSILFTGGFQKKDSSYWKEHYRKLHIEFLDNSDLPPLESPLLDTWFVAGSLRVFQFLRGSDFETIHFQDWQAAGFHSIQAKRVGIAFHNAKLIVTMHSPTEWQNEGMRRWLEWPGDEGKLQYCERYCCAHADTVVSPSRHMIEWAIARGWILAADTQVVSYCFAPDQRKVDRYVPSGRTVAFFGRLETRKGLEVFCDALKLLSDEGRAGGIEDVLFLGKVGETLRGQADVFIRASLAGTRYRVEIHPDLDSFQARALLRRRSALAVCPSLVDNYPLTVLECIMDGVPLVAANTGGIPEMISPSAIFEPTPRALAAMLEGSASGWVTFDDYYDPVESALRWGRVSTPGAAAVGRLADNFAPHVSVIMPHYNYGEYIEQAVQACLEQDYPNLEIVVIDDGSTDQDASDALDRLSKLDKRVRILRQENSGPSSARNNAAREAQGEYLVFVDADNIPRPNMITTLVRSARSADLDIVSCHFWAFARQRKGPASMPESINYRYTPVGPALEVGALENVFGDTNFLVKRQVFLDEGGFPVDDFSNQGGVEDWEFLARATLRGRSLDVVPEPLFWYRIGGTRTATSKPYLGRRAVLRHYAEELAPRIPWLFHSVMYAFAFRYTEKHQYALALQGEAPFARLPFISRNLLRLTTRLDAFLLRRFPAGSRVRRAAKSLFRQSR